MAPFKLLFVEDDELAINTFNDSLARYQVERKREIDVVIKTNLQDSIEAINNSFDGAIVDIKLEHDDSAGNEIINKIHNNFRIPVAVYTGNPSNVTVEILFLKVFIRGTITYDAPLDYLFEIYNTGITKIIGGRGYIEEKMNAVFRDSVYPYMDEWKTYKQKEKDTEKALLRFVINHIVELIDHDVENYFPEEMYIYPVTKDKLKTGIIVKKNGTQNQYYIILNPACDLALHQGRFKTNRIMVCMIETMDSISQVGTAQKEVEIKVFSADNEKTKKEKTEKIDAAKKVLNPYKTNSHCYHLHYLPRTKLFDGGFINFRIIETFTPDEFHKLFSNPVVQISAPFTKDIVARFSSYYARQGQPDFDPDVV